MPRFTALSYLWGDPDVTVPITVNETEIQVTTNLAQALEHVYGHWVASSSKPRKYEFLLWVDAICINQRDLQEKVYQIPLMGDIFSTAELVVSWLGPANDVYHCAMDAIDLIYSELQKVDPEDTTLQWMAGHPSLCSAGKGSWPNPPHSTHDPWNSLRMFIAARYWSRVWIFQEIALARRALVVSGEKSLEWHKISYVNDWIGRVSGRLRARKAKKPVFLGSTAWIALATTDAISSNILDCMSDASTWKQMPLREQDKSRIQAWRFSVIGARLHASDPKDHIYGLIGITGIRVASKSSGPTQLVDVYKNYVSAWLADWRNGKCSESEDNELCELSFLAFSGSSWRHDNLDLPSWVPNYPAASGKGGRTIHDGNADLDVFTGSPTAPPVIESGLKVTGVKLGSVVQVLDFQLLDPISIPNSFPTYISTAVFDFIRGFISKAPRSHSTGMSPLQMVFRLFYKSEYGIEVSPLSFAAVRAAFCFLGFLANSGSPLDQSTEESRRLKLDLLGLRMDTASARISSFKAVFGPIRHSVAEEYIDLKMKQLLWTGGMETEELVLEVLGELHRSNNMTLVVVEGVYIGIGRPGVEVGDKVCVLKGARVPSVLREMEDGGFYVHVCTALVVGLMCGEARSFLESSKSNIQVFELR